MTVPQLLFYSDKSNYTDVLYASENQFDDIYFAL